LPKAGSRRGHLSPKFDITVATMPDFEGTEPVIRVMREADDTALIDSLVNDVCDAIAQAA